MIKIPRGLNKKTIEAISDYKNEPAWMRKFRLYAFEIFQQKPMPIWGADLSSIDFDKFNYFISPLGKKSSSWDELPPKIRKTYDKIGIPVAEQKFLAGVGAQYDSESIYNSLKSIWEKKGVIFTDTDTALREFPELFKEHFAAVIPSKDNKFAALNSAAWSGGSFVYIPKGVKVDIPLQAYFRIDSPYLGQFERTLIIADEESFVHYIEGCSAPIYSRQALHAAVAEIIVKKGARVRYTTVQNWSKNVYNLTTKRMLIEEDGVGEYVDANLGSKITMKYPCFILKGKGAKGELLSLSFASTGQHLDTGGKAIHLAPHTSSIITSKSVSCGGGRSSFRGLVKIAQGAKESKSHVHCHGLLLDKHSQADTYPCAQISEKDVEFSHEATISNIEEEKLFYLMSRGLSKEQATALIVNGFVEPVVSKLPMEYAVELNRLINLQF